MKSTEQVLDETMMENSIRMGWIPETKQAVMKAMENYLQEQWRPLSESPNDGAFHLVEWKLPAPNGDSFIYGVTQAVYDYLGNKEWYRNADNGIRITIKGAILWMPFPKPKIKF